MSHDQIEIRVELKVKPRQIDCSPLEDRKQEQHCQRVKHNLLRSRSLNQHDIAEMSTSNVVNGEAAPALPYNNPVGALLEGLKQVFLATLHLVALIVRFSSVTVPSTLYR